MSENKLHVDRIFDMAFPIFYFPTAVVPRLRRRTAKGESVTHKTSFKARNLLIPLHANTALKSGFLFASTSFESATQYLGSRQLFLFNTDLPPPGLFFLRSPSRC